MAPKHPYIKQGLKELLINKLNYQIPLLQAAKALKINIKTARSIKRRTDQISKDSSTLPLVFNIEERVQIAPKTSRPRILLELDINILDQGIRKDRKHRDML